ncbi:MAG: glycerol-3-phosphate 1-O-acyltransferase PlsY [Alphaproteobacteria bacterium]
MPDFLGSIDYTWPFYAAAVCGYLLGSIPFGLVLTRLAGHGDVRQIGSGSIGATNVLRTGSKPLAAATLVLDGGKGAVAVLVAQMWGQDMAVMAAGGAMLGHCFPVWLLFRGGKGVATFIGIMLAICWPAGIACCLTWLAVAGIFRFSSLAGLAMVIAAPAYSWYFGDFQIMYLAGLMAALVVFRHHANIRRLLTGQEPRIGRKKAASA